MKVEIVSIGTELLVSDILDTNAAYVSRSLRDLDVQLTCKVTVGDDPAMIAEAFRNALQRADVVIASGGVGDGPDDFTREALTAVTPQPETTPPITLGDPKLHAAGLLVKLDECALFCLPGKRREMSYLLETEVLPFLRQQLSADMVTGWTLLRSVGLMESVLKQELADIAPDPRQRIMFDSFAGQTNIRIWVQAPSEEDVQAELAELKQTITDRLGDHIFGGEADRLEQVLLADMLQYGITIGIAECYTNRVLFEAMQPLPGHERAITFIEAQTWQQLANQLQLNNVTPDNLTEWCRHSAEKILLETGCDLGLLVYGNIMPGGVQILVTLASPNGVSVTQRSFGGHPENIDQWALTLGLAHLRRWLLVHS